MGIIMGSDTATNTQPAASPGRKLQCYSYISNFEVRHMINKIVRKYLIEIARDRTNQIVTYQVLADDCDLDLDMSIPHHRKEIGAILGDISIYEHKCKRPLLSSLVVRVGDNYEGDGFYKLGEELGFGDWKKLKREGLFDVMQMRDTINFWTNNLNYKKFKGR